MSMYSRNHLVINNFHLAKKVKVLSALMAHRVMPISVLVALCRTSANAVKATVGGGAGPLVAARI